MDSSKTYPVNEIFVSAQFEGARSGTLNHFVRFSFCNRKCPFCDTVDLNKVWRKMTALEISAFLIEQDPLVKNVVLTGGEPSIYDLEPLLLLLQASGFYTAIETNGDFLDSLQRVRAYINWVTVSPKGPVDKSLLLGIADEVKYIVPDHEGLIDWEHPQIFLQPEWNNPDAFQMCLQLLREHPSTRVSIQTHKYLNIR
jgi:7-carboxy-7-deazaguanine synthase